jgi:predicted N-acetyltransferase YhbS
MDPVTQSAARVVRADDDSAAALAAFYSAAWGQDVSAETLRKNREAAAAANPVTPGEPPPTFIFLKGGEALGHLGTIPVRVWSHGEEHPGYWLKGLWVLPAHQNGPIGFLVLKEAARQLELAMALVVELPARRLFTAHGFVDLGAIPNHMRLLDPARVLRAVDLGAVGLSAVPGPLRPLFRVAQQRPLSDLAGGAFRGATGLWTLARGRGGRYQVEAPAPLDRAELDALWSRARRTIAASIVRNGEYLDWRYGGRHARSYLPVALRSSQHLLGLAIVRKPSASGDPRLRGIRVAVLSELVAPADRPDILLSLLAAAENAAREAGADALLATASHASLMPLLRRRAYLPLPGNVHFMARTPETGPALPRALDAWWLTRGDSDADEAF